MMPRTRPPARDAADFGPFAARHLRMIEDAADPDNPNRTVRRARVSCHYDNAWRRGHLTAEERNACDRYATLTEAAGGAKDSGGEMVGDRQPAHLRDGGMVARVAAQALITDADAALGASAKRMLKLYVVANVSVDGIAEREGITRNLVGGLVLAAVRRLTEHWDKCAPDRR